MNEKMDIIKFLYKYPNIAYYLWMRKRMNVVLPKVLWTKIIVEMIESNLNILFDFLGCYETNLLIKIQRDKDIESLVYIEPQKRAIMMANLEEYRYEINDNILVLSNNIKIDLDSLYKSTLIKGNNLFFIKDFFVYEITNTYESQCYGMVTIFYKNTYYSGELKFGKKCGYGIFYEHGIKRIGNFENDVLCGQGTTIYENNLKYRGYFKENKLEGFGKMIRSNGDRYIGNFIDGIVCGYGKKYYIHGGEYNGFWKDGKRDGFGIFYYPNGYCYIGYWKSGKKHGYGKNIWINGKSYNGIHIEGKLKYGKIRQERNCKLYYTNNIVRKGQLSDINFIGKFQIIFPDKYFYVIEGTLPFESYCGFGIKHKLNINKSCIII